MSRKENTALINRALELIEDISSHPSGYDKLLSRTIQNGDYDELRTLINKIESELSINNFYDSGILSREDVY